MITLDCLKSWVVKLEAGSPPPGCQMTVSMSMQLLLHDEQCNVLTESDKLHIHQFVNRKK